MKKYIDEIIEKIDELIELQVEKIGLTETQKENNILNFEEIKKLLNKTII